jgi:hypothetical protein
VRPITLTLTNGQSQVIPLDRYLNPFQVEVDAVITGTLTYGVQCSNDDPWSGNPPTTFTTTPAAPIPAGSTTSLQGSVLVPVRQLYAAATAGTGSVTIRIIQAGQLG